MLCWDQFRWLVATLQRRFPGRHIHLQTNGTLLTPGRIAFIRRSGVSLEFGIDGDKDVTVRHRCGLESAGYVKLVRNIRLCVAAGIKCGCTMTVHPEASGDMLHQATFLKTLGLGSVDVTPAAFMPWTPGAVAQFRENYKMVIADPSLRQVLLTSEDQEFIHPGVMDLSLHPPGHLLAGDAFLCLPEAQRSRSSLWALKTGDLRPEVLAFYQRAYSALHHRRTRVTYRDLVCCNFDLVNRIMGKEYINTTQIVALMRFLTKMHWMMILKERRRA